MGCVSSRMITRSGSYREDLTGNADQRSGSAGVTVDLLLPKNNDQFLALICTDCTASSFTGKLRSCPPPLPSETGKDVSEETAPVDCEAEVINAWELMADLEDEESAASSDVATGRVNSASEPSLGSQAIDEHDVIVSDGHRSDGDQAGSSGRKISDSEDLPPTDAFTDCEKSEPSRDIQAGRPTADAAKERQASESSSIQCEEPGPSQSFYGTIEPSKSITDYQSDGAQGHKQSVAAGSVSRRRAMAKELAVLTIPTSLEFPVIGSLREWLHGGSTATLMFDDEGKMSASRSMSGGEQDSVGLDPDLLQAFEEALAELNAEEQERKEEKQEKKENQIGTSSLHRRR